MKLPKELLEVITEAVAKQHDKKIDLEKKRKKDWRLRNTSLLLKNYHKLKVHCSGVMFDLERYQEVVYDPDELDLHTLMKYKARTSTMLSYFESILKAFGELSKKQGHAAERRYRIIQRYYIDDVDVTADELAEFYNVDRSTIFRDINKATEELSVLLWGIDSFDDLE